jgi:hypothetical protein
MDTVTLDRDEWVAVARELDTAYRESAPPGLVARIAALLTAMPAGWAGEPCRLELDATSAAVVRRIVRRGRGLPEDPGLTRSQGQAVNEAERILRDDRAAASGWYRVEHRTGGAVNVLARTSAGDARQAELSQHAARLIADGETGELVLVDEATEEEVARRHLGPEPGVGPERTGGAA